MTALLTICTILLVILSFMLIGAVLLHKGKGGGLSDMFGGGLSTSMRSSGVAERNLDRITIILAISWFVVVFIIGFITKILV